MSDPKDAHASGGPSQALLYDANVPTPSHAERALTLAASIGTGTLCTLDRRGYPYGSFVTYALHEGTPVFVISEMAEHTRNLRGDARASLLVVEPGDGDPLARARVTLVGPARVIDDSRRAAALASMVAVHPNAARYADFGDFHVWTLSVEAVRYIGGYGRMSWVEAADFTRATPDPLSAHAAGILAHMNADHGTAMVDCCRAFSKATDTTSATMTSVDRYGFELSALTGDGPRPIRLAFPEPLSTPDEVRRALVAMVKQARG
ncbi:MAG: DUF2470 domain-containing protein [Polyangia bacterium]